MHERPDRPELLRDADIAGAWTIMNGGTEQSWVDPADPTHLEFDYVQRIADGIDAFAPEGERISIVHIGGAGLTLPRYVAVSRPSSAQIVLEPDTDLTERVRAEIPLPRNSGIKIRGVDGRTGIAAMRDDYVEVIVLDAFAGPHIPAELTTVEFFTDVRRVLKPEGMFLVNITDRGPFAYARRVAAAVAQVFPRQVFSAEPSTLKGRRFGNVVIFASGVELPVAALERSVIRGAFPYRLVHGTALTRLIDNATPATDEDPATSPDPRHHRFGF